MAQKRGTVGLAGTVVERDDGELRHAVDGQKHDEPALGVAQLAAVDVDEADRGFGEAAAFGSLFNVCGQPGDAMTLQASVQGAAGKLWDGVAQAAHDVVERQEGAPLEHDDDGLLRR